MDREQTGLREREREREREKERKRDRNIDGWIDRQTDISHSSNLLFSANRR